MVLDQDGFKVMRIGIVGAAGRMGRMLIGAVLAAEGAELAGGVEMASHPDMGRDLGELAGFNACGVALTSDTRALFKAADVIIDFTAPAATVAHAALAADTGARLVIGTTGLNAEQQAIIDRAAHKTALVQAANYSVGVNVLLGLVEQAARILPESYDIEILEMHHHHKVDAPSGTALALGRAAAAGRNVNLDDVADKARDGITGARRLGDIKASSREVFASGAVRAALWVGAQKPGLYSMKDVLGF